MRIIALLLVALAVSLATGARTADAASRAGGCGLPGLVRSPGARPCPRVPATGAAGPRANSILSPVRHFFGSLSGDAFKGLLGVLVSWVVASAAAALRFTTALIGGTTRPALESTWFSATYWRVAAVSALLTLPFLFAAAIHALVRSDLSLLVRAAFGYLPLAMIGVAIAAPITTLLLAATDEMSSFVAAASSHSDATFLARAAAGLASASVINKDPFLGFFVALITVVATVALWIELLVRDAAVDVIVLMLPLFFAAMVWPARRVWAIRAIETLFALILAKFAIVAVLSLGGAAISQGGSGPAALLTGVVLVTLATMSPWALLRLLPIHEVAAAAAGGLSQGPRAVAQEAARTATRSAVGGVDTALGGAQWLSRRFSSDPLDDPGPAGPRTGKPVAREALDSDSLHPTTQAGLDAVNGATPPPAPASAPRPFTQPADDRPPINAPFDRERQWKFVLNESPEDPQRLELSTDALPNGDE
jgi:hypothetical protein